MDSNKLEYNSFKMYRTTVGKTILYKIFSPVVILIFHNIKGSLHCFCVCTYTHFYIYIPHPPLIIFGHLKDRKSLV